MASSSVNSAETAPAELLAVPNSTVPTSSYSLLPNCVVATVTVSPTSRLPSSAAATFSAISSSAVGPRPSATVVRREGAAVDPALEERRGAHRADRFAVGVEHAVGAAEPEREHVGLGLPHAVDRGDRVDGVGGDQRALVAAAEVGAEQQLAAHLGVDVLVAGRRTGRRRAG